MHRPGGGAMGIVDEKPRGLFSTRTEDTPGVDYVPRPPYILVTEVVHLRLRDDKRGQGLPTKSEKQNYMRLLKKWYEEMGYKVVGRPSRDGSHYQLSRFLNLP